MIFVVLRVVVVVVDLCVRFSQPYRPQLCLLLLCAVQDEDFEEMLRTAQAMESQYSHLFDKVIVNTDLSTAFGELRLALRKVEVEAQWVPISWTHS